MTFGDALTAYAKTRERPKLKPKTNEYDDYRIKALLESWPELEKHGCQQNFPIPIANLGA